MNVTSTNLGIAYAMLKSILIEGDISMGVLKGGNFVFLIIGT